MRLWRVSNYADLKGVGGLRASGRWHFAGQPVVYLAEHPALALLEVLVQLEIASVNELPKGYQLLSVEVDDGVPIAQITEADMPTDWRQNVGHSRSAGTEWLQTQPSALLKVPSAVVPCAHNFLLNPAHSAAGGVQIIEVFHAHHDSRILKLFSGSALQ